MTSTRRVLIIDDEPDARRALAAELGAMGHLTETAAEGVRALSAAKQFRPDVILLDPGLPGAGGIDVLERLKAMAQTAAVPVVVVTAREPSGNRDAAMRRGASAYLQKPVERAELRAAVEALRVRGAHSQAA